MIAFPCAGVICLSQLMKRFLVSLILLATFANPYSAAPLGATRRKFQPPFTPGDAEKPFAAETLCIDILGNHSTLAIGA